MPQIVDALLVTLGLDATGMKTGAQDASAAYDKMVVDAKKASRDFQDQMDADAMAFQRKQQIEADAYRESQRLVKVSNDERAKGLANFKQEQQAEADSFKKSQVEKKRQFSDTQESKIKQFKEEQQETKKSTEGYSKLNGQILGVLAAFIGLGAIKNFGERVIEADAHVQRLSGTLGESAESINAWQMAAERFGASGSEIEDAFRSTNKFQEELAKGSPEAINKLNEFASTIQALNNIRPNDKQINVNWARLSDKTLSAQERMLEISKVLNQLSEKDGALVAAKLGYSENVARFLHVGADELERSLKAAKELDPAFADASKESLALSKEWVEVRQNIKGAADSALTLFYPALKASLDIIKSISETVNSVFSGKGGEKLSKPGEISYDAMGNATGYSVDQNESDTGSTPDQIKKMREKDAAIRSGQKIGEFDRSALPSASQKNPSLAPTQQDEISITKKLMSMGWTQQQAAGMVGSLKQESNLNPAAINPSSGAYGIGQWLGPRVDDFKRTMGKDLVGSSLDEQLKFMQWELTHSEKSAGDRLRASSSVSDAAQIHAEAYERPGKDEANIQKRKSNASAIDDSLSRLMVPGPAIDRGLLTGAGAALATSSSTTNNSQSSSTHQVETNINGPINIHTQATDASGISKEIGQNLQNYAFASNANFGLQ